MRAASALLAVVGLALAEPLPHATFYYEMSSSLRRVDDGCRVCYGHDDCMLLPSARCEYFLEIDEIMAKPELDGEGSLVDNILSELTEQATMSWLAQECIPLISYHTTCNKDNICIGCESCHCDAAGKWTCRREQRCRSEPKLDLDHRTLVMVMEKLLESEKKVRRKRLVENATNMSEMKPINLMDKTKLIYGEASATDKDLKIASGTATELAANKIHIDSTTQPPTTSIDSELDFEEVLRNIADDQIYRRRKSQLFENNEITLDYMNLDDTKTSGNNTSETFMKMLNAIEEGNSVTETTDDSKFVVDLYPRENQNNYEDYNAHADSGSDYLFADLHDYGNAHVSKEDNNTLDVSSETIKLDSVHIMKRDVAFITDVNNITQYGTVVPTTSVTILNKGDDLKKHVLIPLTNIINDKQIEMKQLLRIRENLLNIVDFFHNETGINITKESEGINGSSTNLSIYKLGLFPEIHENLRRINPEVMGKLLYKLKRDIYEVFKDISRIQKLSKTEGLSDDLRLLIRSMKYYVNKQGNIRDFKKKEIQLQKINDTRKISIWKDLTTPKSIIRELVDILEVIDKDAPQSNDFLSSSISSKKVIKRVIKQNCVADLSGIGFKTYDYEYNMTNDLRTIGKSWPQLTAKLANSPPHDKLYAMKLLHFNLAEDINKVTDAIAVIDFAHSRRMTPIESPMAENLMIKINSGLISIKHKIQTLIKHKKEIDSKVLRERQSIKEIKKESFLKKIRNMLRSSKTEIVNMVKKKVPKTEIFRTIAQKKLDELSRKRMSEDTQTKLRWQDELNVSQRKKRDVAKRIKIMKQRMKNIIPRYLRNINPIVKHKSKKQSGTKKQKTNKHKNKRTSTVKPKKETTSSLKRDTFTVTTKVRTPHRTK